MLFHTHPCNNYISDLFHCSAFLFFQYSVDKEKDSTQRERGSSPEAKTTDSGYVSPPELPLHAEHEQNSPTKDKDPSHHCCTRELGKCNNCPTTDLDDDVDEKYFNSFLFWRDPLPQVEFELSSINSKVKNKDNPKTKSEEEDNEETDSNKQKNDVKKSNEKEENEDNSVTKVTNEDELTPTNSPRLAFNRDDEIDSEDEDAHLFSLADDVHDDFDYDDYRDMKLQHSTSFEEELLLADHLTPPPKQVL
jgi:hypothetical protein